MIIDEQYINNLILSNAEETLTLEFKSKGALNNNKEIAKDVSAMANSAGGILIYGINESNHKADSIDFIDGNKFTKETLERIIHSNVHRKIPNLKIVPIRFNQKIEKSIYAIVIPESIESPHMVEKKYYKRLNFESVGMEEYEVRNLYFRTNKPKIAFVKPLFELEKPNGISLNNESNKMYSIQGNIYLYLKNTGDSISRNYKAVIILPEKLLQEKHINPKDEIYELSSYKENNSIVISSSFNVPIFPGENKSKLMRIPIRVHGSHIDEYLNGKLKITLFHDGGIVKKAWSLTKIITNNGNSYNKSDFQFLKPCILKPEDFKK